MFGAGATAPNVVIDRDGLVTYVPDYLEPGEADAAFDALRREIPWRQDAIRIAGRTTPLPRLTAWFGDPGATYVYSGIRNEPLPWTPSLARLRARVDATCGVRFNSALVNRYRSGSDGMGWHADDEPTLGPEPLIASISLGAARVFQLRHRASGEVRSLGLEHGSLLTMSGASQRWWTHRVPKTKHAGERINLTFRIVAA